MMMSHVKRLLVFPNPVHKLSRLDRICLVTGTTGLGDDALELIDLLLGTTESSELEADVSMLF